MDSEMLECAVVWIAWSPWTKHDVSTIQEILLADKALLQFSGKKVR